MQTQSGKIEAYQPLYRVPSRGIVPNEYDFCLSAVDSAVSPNSDTKVLNALSNKVMKQILIGNVFTVEIENLRRKYEGENCDGDVDCLHRIKYLNCLSALAEGKQLNSLIRELTPTYQRAYDRILSVLQDNGCTLSVSKDDQEVSLVQRPPDADFCLSVYDFRSDEPSMTRDLNTIVNEVTRMLRFGTEEEINNLGIQLDADLQSFLELGAAGLGLQGVPASYRVTASFTSWERELRKTNTAKFWDPQPEYLWGEWSIGDDRSETSGRRPFEYVDDPENKLTVIKLKSDGSVHLEGGGGGDGGAGGKQERLQGLRWELTPGPTHLDTLTFQVASGQNNNRLLTYTSYIDRGQRLETMFSGRPIRAKGRVTVPLRGKEKIVNSFFMQQKGKKKSFFWDLFSQ